MRIAFLGDGWVARDGLSNHWTKLILDQFSNDLTANVYYASRGLRSDQIMSQMDNLITSDPNIVILSCGRNDATTNNVDSTIQSVLNRVQYIYNECYKRNIKFIILSYSRITYPASSGDIEFTSSHDNYLSSLHNGLRDLAYDNNIQFCNLYVDDDLDENFNPQVFQPDKMHLNQLGMPILARNLAPYIQNVIDELKTSSTGSNLENTSTGDLIVENMVKEDTSLKSLVNAGKISSSFFKSLTSSSIDISRNINNSGSSSTTSGNNVARTSTRALSNDKEITYKYSTKSTEGGIINSSSEQELIGEGQIDDPELVVSFEKCKYIEQDTQHKCKYRDIDDRCIFDHCVWDKNELPRQTRKWYTQCIICTKVFSRDPRYMKAIICDSCLKRMQAAESLPFTCVNCGKKQNHPAIIMFSSICDYCTQHKLFNTCCKHFSMLPKGIHGINTNHEPIY